MHIEIIVDGIQANPLSYTFLSPSAKHNGFLSRPFNECWDVPFFALHLFAARIAQFVHLRLTLAMASLFTPRFREKISYQVYSRHLRKSELNIMLIFLTVQTATCVLRAQNKTSGEITKMAQIASPVIDPLGWFVSRGWCLDGWLLRRRMGCDLAVWPHRAGFYSSNIVTHVTAVFLWRPLANTIALLMRLTHKNVRWVKGFLWFWKLLMFLQKPI